MATIDVPAMTTLTSKEIGKHNLYDVTAAVETLKLMDTYIANETIEERVMSLAELTGLQPAFILGHVNARLFQDLIDGYPAYANLVFDAMDRAFIHGKERA